jgi:lipid-binding SYLF domain-containing protein
MNEKGMRDLLSSKFQIGGDASVAAGPVGRHVEAGTDVSFRSEILTYSRSRGVFAGISLKGATVRQDDDSTVAFYGKKVPYENILAGKVKAPPEARTFLAAVRNAEASTAAEKAK